MRSYDPPRRQLLVARSSLRAQAKPGHRDVSVSGSTREGSRAIPATQLCWDLWALSGSHSTLSWRHLGWAVPPVPRDAGGTLRPAPRALAGPAATCDASMVLARTPPKLQVLQRVPPRVPMHALDGFRAYRPHPDTYKIAFQGRTAGKSNTTIS